MKVLLLKFKLKLKSWIKRRTKSKVDKLTNELIQELLMHYDIRTDRNTFFKISLNIFKHGEKYTTELENHKFDENKFCLSLKLDESTKKMLNMFEVNLKKDV